MCAAILLFSDWHSRIQTPSEQQNDQKIPIALLKVNSNLLLDEAEQGFIDGLASHGFRDGDNVSLKRFCPEGDFSVQNIIARQITDGSYPLVASISTPSLQAVANANRDGRAKHVFCAVTDPVYSGVGIDALNSLDKPKYLTGIGTFQPVEELFRAAKELNNELQSIGVVWSPAEKNSEACLLKARKVSQDLGISLLEAPIEASKDIAEAQHSLIARGVEAIWVGCDVTVNNSMPIIVQIAKSAGIPILSNIYGYTKQGALLDLGANYWEVGQAAAKIVVDVLNGKSPGEIPVVNFMPQRIAINKHALQGLKEKWSFPASFIAKAELVIDEIGETKAETNTKTTAIQPLSKKWRVQMINYTESVTTDEVLAGINSGFKQAGPVAGRDFEVKYHSAQGDIATLNNIFDAAITEGGDLFFVLSTTAMQVALARIKDKPIVFSYVADPFSIGIGKSETDHLANVTGVYTLNAFSEVFDVITKYFPRIKKVGTLFCPAEVNSVINKDLLVKEATKRGITVDVVPVNSSSELPDAALVLSSRKIEAITQISDNLSSVGFSAIATAAKSARLPIISLNSPMIKEGASITISRDYFSAGEDAAIKASEVMRGKSPGLIPIALPQKLKKSVNLANARAVAFEIPKEFLLQTVDENNQPFERDRGAVTDANASSKTPNKTWHISLIQLVDAPAIEASRNGVLQGLKESGLIEGKDYILKVRDAQGDMPTLTAMLDAAVSERVDMVYTITTPALQSAMQKIKTTPIIFTLALDPLLVGDRGTHENHLSNVAGIYDRSPFEGMMKLVAEVLPRAKTIGTLYAPSEQNSVNFKEELERVAHNAGYKVIAVPSNSPAEVSDAALALTGRGIDVICQINDNLHGAAFPTIIGTAKRAHIPVFGFSSDQTKSGAVLTLANDHEDGGRESALIAARVIRGESPARIPYQGISKTKLGLNLNEARALNITIATDLQSKADNIVGE